MQHTSTPPLSRSAQRRKTQLFSALLLIGGLAGCGGGGGGDAPAAPPAPPSGMSATLGASNANTAAKLATGLAENSLLMAQLAADELRDQAARGGQAASVPCAASGTRDTFFDDRDASGGLTAGDHLQVQYSACAVTMLEGQISGTVDITLAAPALVSPSGAWAGELQAQSPLQIVHASQASGQPDTSRMQGGLHFESQMNKDGVDLRVGPAATDDLQWQVPNADTPPTTERIVNPKLGKQLDYVKARGRVDIQFTLQSEALDGNVTVASSSGGVTGWIGRLPDTGAIRITAAGAGAGTGAGAGSVSVKAQSADGTRDADLAVDGDGNGVVESTTDLPWDQLAHGFLWWAQGLVPLSTSGSSAYNIPPAGTPGLLRYGIGPTDDIALDTVFDWTFSIPLEATQMPALVLEREASGAPSDPGLERVPLNLQLRGARLTLTPTHVLQAGRTYHLAMLNPANPSGPTQLAELTDIKQRAIVLFDAFTTQQAAAPMAAVSQVAAGSLPLNR
jgi:hypothetical protein